MEEKLPSALITLVNFNHDPELAGRGCGFLDVFQTIQNDQVWSGMTINTLYMRWSVYPDSNHLFQESSLIYLSYQEAIEFLEVSFKMDISFFALESMKKPSLKSHTSGEGELFSADREKF